MVLAKDFLEFAYIFRDPDLHSEEVRGSPRLVAVAHGEQARKFREKCWHAQAEQVVQSSVEALTQLKDWKKAGIHSA